MTRSARGGTGGVSHTLTPAATTRFGVEREPDVLVARTIDGSDMAGFIHVATTPVVATRALPHSPTNSEMWLSLMK